ncbi:hypothetical protein FSP39_013932 [Pinctada imbricata]|uniref:Uncharacterized protein n=1 Tax=Pinctada imbricata TaxID=66713 RepID=A0AA88YD28_PINIB|nr:hypothetical protein FSP39_013932 [Pinctada imbricata]
MFRLRHVDLNVLYKSAKEGLEIADRMFKKPWNKDEKFMCSIFGYTCSSLMLTRKRVKTAPTLIPQATQFVKRTLYPKMALRSAFCNHIYRDRVLKWSSEAPLAIPKSINGINDTSIQFCFSYPERVNESGNLLCKSLDCSHNLTHLRVRICSKNLLGVSLDAWKLCAKFGETCLSFTLVEDKIDKQSVPNARTHFSKEVEAWMMEHKFVKEAKFVRLVRNWYDASDSLGNSAIDRVRRLLELGSSS